MLKLTLIMGLLLYATGLRAQDLSPTGLFQIYRYWQMDDSKFDKNTYDYIQTVDSHWGLRIDPQKSEKGLTLLMGYFKDKVWYKDEECRIMFDFDRSQKSKSVMFLFVDQVTWNNYNKQMILMNADNLQTHQVQGNLN